MVNTNQLYVDTSAAAVGIGTTGPDRKLDILDASNPQLRLTHTDGSVFTDLRSVSTGGLAITTNNLTSNGAYGIQGTFTVVGTAASQTYYGQKLAITNSQTTNANTLYGQHISFTDAGSLANTVTGLYVDATTANTADTTHAAILLGGFVGIGDSTPTAEIDASFSNGGSAIMRFINTSNATGARSIVRAANDLGDSASLTAFGSGFTSSGLNIARYGRLSGSSVGLIVGNDGAVPIIFGVSGAENMRLHSDGNFGIGDTTPDALFDIDSTATTTDVMGILASSLTSGTALTVTGPTTTGVTDHFIKVSSDIGSGASLLNLNPDFSGSGVLGRGIYNVATDSTNNPNTDVGYYGTLTLTGNAAKTAYGIYQEVNSSSTTADILLGMSSHASATGIITSGTRNVYGLESVVFADAQSTGGTTNAYGLLTRVTADVGAGGIVNGYGLYIANGTFDTDGTSTNTGLYVETPTGADNNYAAIFQGGNVGIGNAAPGTTLDVTGTGRFSSTLTASNGLTLTTGALNLTATSGSEAITGYGTSSRTSTTTTGNINTLANSSLAPASTQTANLLNLTFTNSSTNSAGTTSTTSGLNIAGTNTSSGVGGTMNTHGIRLQDMAGIASSGTQNNYGIRVGNYGQSGAETSYGLFVDSQTGSTNNYAAIFAGGNVGGSVTRPQMQH